MTMKSAASIRTTSPRQTRCALFFLLTTLLWGAPLYQLVAQGHSFSVTDQVDLPSALGGGTGSGLHLEIEGRWTLYPDRPALLKETRSIRVRETLPGTGDEELLQHQLQARIGQLPVRRGKAAAGEVQYEFTLLDPHLSATGTGGFPEPDSMDSATRELQSALIEMVKGRIRNIDRYELEAQLLSVRFHETWSFDPATRALERQVNAITPVIWQRRRTVEGEPVNDAETGWPVYYKNILTTIDLRNP